MKIGFLYSSNTIPRFLRAAFVLLPSILVFWFIANEKAPQLLRPLSLLLRTGFTIVVPSTYFVLYLTSRLKRWPGRVLSFVLTMSIFALALSGVWMSGQTESGLLSGVIPMFDSATYYADALRLLAGQSLSDASTRRPIFTAFFAFLLWVSKHNLLTALVILTFLVAFACTLLAREVELTHGPAVAVFVLVFIFVYYRYHSGVVRTENLGIMFGALGTAFIWRSITKRKPLFFLAGIFLTSIGMIARAGAFFTLPLLALWGSRFFRGERGLISWRFLIYGLLALAGAFIANQVIMKSFGTSNVVPFGNFSYSLYGLAAGGKSWAYVTELYPTANDIQIYKMAFQLMLENPGLFVKGVIYNYSMFFSNTSYGIFSYMRGEGELASTLSYWILLILSFLGIFHWVRHRDDPYLGFIAVSTFGLLLSVPFLPPTDAFRLRAYATSIVILGLLPAIGLYDIVTKLKLCKPDEGMEDLLGERSLVVFGTFVFVIVSVGPFLARGTDRIPNLDSLKCNNGLVSAVVRYDPGGMINFVSQSTPLLDRAPTFHIGTFRRSVHGFPDLSFTYWALEKVRPADTLFSTIDYRTFRHMLVWIENDTIPAPPALIELCGSWEDDPKILRFDIFYAKDAYLIDQK